MFLIFWITYCSSVLLFLLEELDLPSNDLKQFKQYFLKNPSFWSGWVSCAWLFSTEVLSFEKLSFVSKFLFSTSMLFSWSSLSKFESFSWFAGASSPRTCRDLLVFVFRCLNLLLFGKGLVLWISDSWFRSDLLPDLEDTSSIIKY